MVIKRDVIIVLNYRDQLKNDAYRFRIRKLIENYKYRHR